MANVTIRRLGERPYSGPDPSQPGGHLQIAPGETAETSEENALRLLDDYPADFELVWEKAAAEGAPSGGSKSGGAQAAGSETTPGPAGTESTAGPTDPANAGGGR